MFSVKNETSSINFTHSTKSRETWSFSVCVAANTVRLANDPQFRVRNIRIFQCTGEEKLLQ